MTRDLQPDWRPAAEALGRWPVETEPRAALIRRLEDFPDCADVIRRAGAGVRAVVDFPITFSGAHGVVLLNPPSPDLPIAVTIYRDRLALDGESFIRVDDDGLSKASINFWSQLSERLGRSLSRGVAH
jgi:hypothetical protein